MNGVIFQNGIGNIGGSTYPAQFVKPKNDKLSIFYINDLHGNTDNIGGLFSAAKYFDLKNSSATDTLKLSGGDNYAGSDKSKNTFVMSLLSNLGIQYSAVGNHEFDPFAQGFEESTKKSNVKYVSSNIDIDKDNKLSETIVKSAIYKGRSGQTYGIVGSTTPDIKNVTITGAIDGIEVEDYEGTIEEIQEEVDKLKEKGVNKIILVSHTGYQHDRVMAQNLSGVDVIISGHSHDLIEDVKKGENLVVGRDNKPVVIVQAGSDGRNYGILDLEFDSTGTIQSIKNSIETTVPAKIPFIRYAEDTILGGGEKVGNIAKIDDMPKNRRISPCAWTNFLCDAMKNEFDTDIAFINSANIRKVPDTGKLTQREISESAPFDNTLLTTTMSEKEIVEAIKFANKSMTAVDNVPGLLQVSGLRYEIDKRGNLLALNFVDKKGKITPLNVQNPSEKGTFKVVYDSFLADGREYPPLGTKNKQTKPYNIKKDEVAQKYISKMPENARENLKITDDYRLQIKN